VEKFGGLPSMQEAGARAKATFQAQFRRTQAYELLNPMRAYDHRRLDRLEDACWRFRCAATRKELKGARARRALSLLLRLKRELGEPCWLPEQVPTELDRLQDQLIVLASKKRQGRPRDSIGKLFRRSMRNFFTPMIVLKDGCRSLSQTELDEVLSDLFKVAIGRVISLNSYVRMRKREQAADNKAMSASRRRRPISLNQTQRYSGRVAARSGPGSAMSGPSSS
jgi:hypothetical protein